MALQPTTAPVGGCRLPNAAATNAAATASPAASASATSAANPAATTSPAASATATSDATVAQTVSKAISTSSMIKRGDSVRNMAEQMESDPAHRFGAVPKRQTMKPDWMRQLSSRNSHNRTQSTMPMSSRDVHDDKTGAAMKRISLQSDLSRSRQDSVELMIDLPDEAVENAFTVALERAMELQSIDALHLSIELATELSTKHRIVDFNVNFLKSLSAAKKLRDELVAKGKVVSQPVKVDDMPEEIKLAISKSSSIRRAKAVKGEKAAEEAAKQKVLEEAAKRIAESKLLEEAAKQKVLEEAAKQKARGSRKAKVLEEAAKQKAARGSRKAEGTRGSRKAKGRRGSCKAKSRRGSRKAKGLRRRRRRRRSKAKGCRGSK